MTEAGGGASAAGTFAGTSVSHASWIAPAGPAGQTNKVTFVWSTHCGTNGHAGAQHLTVRTYREFEFLGNGEDLVRRQFGEHGKREEFISAAFGDWE